MIHRLFKLARPIQWIKNGIVLAPLVFAGEAGHIGKVQQALLAAIIFCLLSSALYIVNDIIDRDKDKQHPVKRYRPIASGQASVGGALGLSSLLLIAAAAAITFLPPAFAVATAVFVVLNIVYTFALKNFVILDVMSIALSFVLRAYAGAMAIEVTASTWMLINTFLLALFLAFGKRRHELVLLASEAASHRQILSKYSPYLLDQLIAIATTSVVVMYMLYSFSSEVSEKLNTDKLYVTIPFVVYGIFRYLYLIHKEEKGGSPTNVMFDDKPILLTVMFWMLSVYIVLYWRP